MINTKYEEGFFVKELMEDYNPLLDSMRSTQTTMFSAAKLDMKSEKDKFKKHAEECSGLTKAPVDLNFLQFVRPGTAYGAAMYNTGGSTGSFGYSSEEMTRPNSSWKRSMQIKPSQIIQCRGGKSNKNFLWFERAEKIMREVKNTYQVLDNIEYM